MKKQTPIWVCSECGTDFDNEDDYLSHVESECDE